MDLIDRAAFVKEMKMRQNAVEAAIENANVETYYTDKEHWEGVLGTFAEVKLTLDNMPTIEAVPVVHGKWEYPEPSGVMTWDKRAYAQCSACKQKAYLGRHDNYCRFCGAKMEVQNGSD